MAYRSGNAKSAEPITRDELHLAFAMVPHTVGVTRFDKAINDPNIRWGLEKIVMINRRRGRNVRTIPNFND